MGFPDGILVVCCVLLGRSLTGFPDGTGIAFLTGFPDCLMYIGDDLRIVVPEEKKNSSVVVVQPCNLLRWPKGNTPRILKIATMTAKKSNKSRSTGRVHRGIIPRQETKSR